MKTRQSILIADDEAGPREALNQILKPFFQIYNASNGSEALTLVRSKHLDLVILDLNMPGLSGTEVLGEIKKIKGNIEVIILTGYGSMKTAVEALRLGASDYILKPFNIAEMMDIVNRTLSKKDHHDRLSEFLTQLEYAFGKQSSVRDIRDGLARDPGLLKSFREILAGTFETHSENEKDLPLEFVRLLTETLEAKDPFTLGHSNRIHYYSSLMAQDLKLGPEEQRDLQMGAYLHDIGNLGIEVKTLYKEGAYTREEHLLIQKHVEIGFELIGPIDLPKRVVSIIRNHHELYNGSGYPDGLTREEIPLLTRIVAIAECLDAMLTERPYRKIFPLDRVVHEFKRCSGVQFDPVLVEKLLGIIREKGENILPKRLKPNRALEA